ncbi:arsenate reductase ArsC [Candidatus Albibeggiatoa sp. nov. BB20]|uniref:arsenate reductase ArsC n=1 Tax=Candidatus Albibeggiatoa sp. nov. BB20 TaxID=3162723 RepID=UPI00336554D8
MTGKKRVLFVCIHNSARSQMAEAWFNELCADNYIANSAGIEPGSLNPLVVKVMQEAGVDISHKQTNAVMDYVKSGDLFSYVITVCDETSAERCPIFPGVTTRLHWSFPDPSVLEGTEEQKLVEIRKIRDTIKAKIADWIKELN